MKKIFKFSKWICPQEFADTTPLNVFHLEKENIEIDLPEELKNLHFFVKKDFAVNAIKKTTIRITADDYYKLVINGKFVGQGPAQGYYFNYYWNEFDITDYLKSGKNEIEVEVYYHGIISRSYNSGDKRIGMICEVYSDNKLILFSDDSWEYALSNAYFSKRIIGNNTMFLQDFDSREKHNRWRKCVQVNTDYIFEKNPVKPVQTYIQLPVVSEKLSCVSTFYDFGVNLAGSLLIRAKGKSGKMIRIYSGEEIDDNPLKVKYNMRTNCCCEEIWILDDGECEYFQYDYKGFRYVTLVADEDCEIISVAVMVRHYPFDDNFCKLETENEKLRSVWQICKNAVKYGSQEVYVDCITREKGQYSGDMTITSASQIILTGDISLLKKAIDNQMQSAVICKGLMAVTPGSFMQEIADYSLQFPLWCLRYYNYSNDKEYLMENLKIAEGISEYFKQYERDDGLLQNVSDKWNLVDWPANFRDNYDFKLEPELQEGCHNVINAFFIGFLKGVEKMQRILNIKSENQIDKRIEAFNREFFDKKKKLYKDTFQSKHTSLHSNILPVFYGFNLTESNENIHKLIMSKGMCCGVYMSYFLLKALCKLGYFEDALYFITSDSEHSWMNMVNEGATTCFEAWGKDQKWNTSLCHPWASGPISVLAEDILPNIKGVGKLIINR